MTDATRFDRRIAKSASTSRVGALGRIAVAVLILVSVPAIADIARASCEILPFTAPETRGDHDGAYYWYEAAEMRGGAECALNEPDGSELVLHFVPDEPLAPTSSRFNQFIRIDVTTKDGRLLQRLDDDRRVFDSPPPSMPYLRVDDVNFDGYPDVGVFLRFEIPGNALYAYWLFDPATHRFVRLVGPALSNPRVDAGAKAVIAESNDGGAGKLFTRTTYRVRDGRLEAIQDERQRWIDGRYVHETRNLADQEAPAKSDLVPDDPPSGYGTLQWRVVASAIGNVVPGAKGADVALLASRDVTNLSGFDVPQYDANLVIFDGERVLYRLRADPPRPSSGAHDCSEPNGLALRDVTGDGVPEVMFRCGQSGVSDFSRQLHVLHYDARRSRFEDVAPEDFVDTGLGAVQWRAVNGIPMALTGHAQWGDGEGHFGAHYYDYTAYCWDARAGAFTAAYHAKSDVKLDVVEWRHDLERRLPAIRAVARKRCRSAPPPHR